MKKPVPRPDLHARRSNNDKRRLMVHPTPSDIAIMRQGLAYGGSSKHKRNPHLFALPPFLGSRSDETLCDEHAGFRPGDMVSTPELLERSLRAGLIGEGKRILWSVADNGWIFEARQTVPGRNEFHGYPVTASESIAEVVYGRFRVWADMYGTDSDKAAALNCQRLYGFRR